MELCRGFEKSNRFLRAQIKNQGQATVEAVLLATILVGSFLFVTKTMKQKQVLQKFTTSSISRVKNMTEYGTWRDACKPLSGSGGERAANCHPNSINRSLSSRPD